MEPETAKSIVKGSPDPLYSAFHLKYSMLLNMLRLEDSSPEKMIQRTFCQFQAVRSGPNLEDDIRKYEELLSAHTVTNEEVVINIY